VKLTDSQLTTEGKIQDWEVMKTDCLLPRTHANEQKQCGRGDVRANIWVNPIYEVTKFRCKEHKLQEHRI